MEYAKGIDLSRYNGRGDWTAVKTAGVSFAIIKAGGVYTSNGVCYTDNLLENHLMGVQSVGIPWGLFWYFVPWAPMSNQIDYFTRLLTNYGSILPPVIDVESSNGMAAKTTTAYLETMVKTLRGYHPLGLSIYTRASYWNTNILVTPEWDLCHLWAARWSSGLTGPWSDGYWKFRDWSDWKIWQYQGDNNARAREFGFPGPPEGDPDIDLDFYNGSEAELYAWLGFGEVLTLEQRVTDLEFRVTQLEAAE